MCDLLVWVSSPQRELGGRAPGTHFRVEGVQYCLIWPSSKILLLCRICHVGKVNFCVDYDNCQEGEFCLVPSACFRLSQVGHLLLPWAQMGSLRGIHYHRHPAFFTTRLFLSRLISSWLNSLSTSKNTQFLHLSVTKAVIGDILGTKSGIIDPLVSKRRLCKL